MDRQPLSNPTTRLGAALLLGALLSAPAASQQRPYGELFQLTADSGYASLDYYFGQALSMSGQRLVVGAPTIQDDFGTAYVFDIDWTTDTWTQIAQFHAADRQLDDRFGDATAIDGAQVAVGAPEFDGGRGATFLFDAAAPDAPEVKLLPPTGSGEFGFGSSLALRGDLLLVGAPGADQVHVFQRVAGAWGVERVLTPDLLDQPRDADFGAALALGEDLAVIGAPKERRVYVFERDASGQWAQVQVLAAPGTSAAGGSRFGKTLALDGQRLVVGAPSDEGEGGAHVFTRTGSQWALEASLAADGVAADARFGNSVAIEGDLLVVGAPGDDVVLGSTLVYEAGAAGWERVAEILPVESGSGEFSKFVGISAGRVLTNIGLDDAPVFGAYSGAVKVWSAQPERRELELYSEVDGATPPIGLGGQAATPMAALSASRGGRLELRLRGGAAEAGHLYLLLGSASGTDPGVPLAQGHLPLNLDHFLSLTLSRPTTVFLENSQGLLDATGASPSISFDLPPGALRGFAGTEFSFAALVMDGPDLRTAAASNALSLRLLP